jgi:hypothetical protein|tara:strand:- start:2609 stop:3178 length:570 start_codon:yes stop_codon:yes gene_type:complete
MATIIKNKLIKNFFNKKELDIMQKYCTNKFNQSKDYALDSHSFSPQWYDDPLMTSFLDIKLPMVEKESKLKLFPTYAYWRYYIYGGKLPKHIDRPSCEVSITSCIKKHDDWPIFIEGKKFELNEGDAVLYNGLLQDHWRKGIYKGEGIAQVFFHYVNKNGKFTDHKYDNYYKTTGNQAHEKDLKWMKKP